MGASAREHSRPAYGHGKLCYVELPAASVEASAEFYHAVFGWHTRRRGDGALAFDDAVNQVSGCWIEGRAPAADPQILIYIMVDDALSCLDAIEAHGGRIVQSIGADAPEITARFSDPAGNVLGLYRQPPGLSA